MISVINGSDATLLLFLLNRKTGHKKKLNTFIHFPEVMDMSQYIGKPGNGIRKLEEIWCLIFLIFCEDKYLVMIDQRFRLYSWPLMCGDQVISV